ncbi:MAG: hypothetical protein FJ279_29600 [Planctomycetes bacterium]|nr:hypothetical protein [Planctomycetota bacterium]
MAKATAWWAENYERLDARISRGQAKIAAQALRGAVARYGDGILRVTHETHGLSPEALAQVRFFTANQDFRQPPANQFTQYLDDPDQFEAEKIADDPGGYLRFMKLIEQSQTEKRLQYAHNAGRFLLTRDITAYEIAAHYGHDAKGIRDAIIAEPNMGYGMKKTNMFLRDMFVWGVWPNLKNLDVVDVASDRNTMKVALRARILETDIPLLSSFLDIFCHQYTYIDEMSGAAWRAVWEEWRALDPATAPASPCLMDFLIYRIGREYCKQFLVAYQCDVGHRFYWFSSRRRACPSCRRGKDRPKAHPQTERLPCQVDGRELPRDAKGKLSLSTTNLLHIPFDGLCPLEPACRPKAEDFKALAGPKSISIKGRTSWTSAYAKREEGGGGLMS